MGLISDDGDTRGGGKWRWRVVAMAVGGNGGWRWWVVVVVGAWWWVAVNFTVKVEKD